MRHIAYIFFVWMCGENCSSNKSCCISSFTIFFDDLREGENFHIFLGRKMSRFECRFIPSHINLELSDDLIRDEVIFCSKAEEPNRIRPTLKDHFDAIFWKLDLWHLALITAVMTILGDTPAYSNLEPLLIGMKECAKTCVTFTHTVRLKWYINLVHYLAFPKCSKIPANVNQRIGWKRSKSNIRHFSYSFFVEPPQKLRTDVVARVILILWKKEAKKVSNNEKWLLDNSWLTPEKFLFGPLIIHVEARQAKRKATTSNA